MFNWGHLKLEISISDDLFSHGWKGVIREGAVFRQQLLAISSLMRVLYRSPYKTNTKPAVEIAGFVFFGFEYLI